MSFTRRRSSQGGSSIIEFAFITFLLMLVIFASIEFDRLMLVYTTVANSARAGARYAIVHGSDRTGTGDPASGPGNTANVETVVRNFAGSGMLDTARLNVSVEYPTNNKPGSEVRITVIYPYDPFVFLPLKVNLNSRTRGIIVF
jgi:Flp pilus assembly protein TadG